MNGNAMGFLTPWTSRLLSVLRIVVALLFLQHGLAKHVGIPHVPIYDSLPLFAWPFGIAGIIEIVFGILLLVGLWTRLAAFILSGEMAIAYFWIHQPNSLYPMLNGGESAVFFCFTFLYLASAGGGPWAIDAAIGARRKPPQ
jgi:putative oxidoreductase